MGKLRCSVGNWVEGEEFWDREVELKLLIEYLRDGEHIHIMAQRRMGKTSLMHEASRRLLGEFTCLHVDLQKCTSAADVVAQLGSATRPIQDLWSRTKAVFTNVLDTVADRVDSLQVEELGIKLRDGVDHGNWRSKGDQLLSAVAASDRPVILFFDEVPILLNRILKGADYVLTPERREAADQFMSWLRENSIKYKGALRLVVTGSIGIEPILHDPA